ncbi:MAG: bifunctional diaminohydroxyphosphoribosylaminopyrimidine deaminase/5-amino-6-(5-phosphoribosylamino)uracil reductase RibD [Candidatus Omnitrophota bacterium]|nr:MAG: bifunctional diaminohydroxyphosphoribosylaminopyrimidine deaminase/5-amino-6-(5-phosphoribosylamino)uracil reductase RibD [Candidatus Omnitrophota bacterium]
MVLKKHKQFMLRAIELARKAEGHTFPNPLVGALVVKKGKIVGEGYHKKAGSAHAEITALKKAKKNAQSASLYINLEPCAHYGKTPPCVNTIIKSGIKSIYVAMKDPNPLVNGKGLDKLRKNGIKIKTGICRKEAKRLNKVYVDVYRNN